MARAAASRPFTLLPPQLGLTPRRAVLAISLHLPTLLLRLHLPLLPGFAPVVDARLPCPRSAPRDTVTLTVTVAGVLTTASRFLSPSLLLVPLALLACRACVVLQVALSPPHANCSVGFCSTHCTSRRCQRRFSPSVQPRCRRPTVGTSSTRLSTEILQLALHQFLLRGAGSSVGKRPGERLAGERRLRDPNLSRSAQLPSSVGS